MRKLLMAMLWVSTTAYANEPACLSKILYAEAKGESFPGIVGLGQAAITLAKNQNKTLCGISGVHREQVPQDLREYYLALSRQLLATKSTSVSKGATHWDRGTKPHMKGRITRQIDHHVFYRLED